MLGGVALMLVASAVACRTCGIFLQAVMLASFIENWEEVDGV